MNTIPKPGHRISRTLARIGCAGGVVYAASYSVTAGAKTITIGSGGAGATANGTLGANGQNSVFDVSGGAGFTITANGGGGGSSYNKSPGTGDSGGSGGGGSF
jgi:D-arabinose 1-dehydrogenase-like Zn-dependent alcohol dehydrogenase